MGIDNPFELVSTQRDPEQHDGEAARRRLESQQPPRSLLDFQESAPYFQPDENLLIAINMALAVGAPLLLTGEPGTGKTQVAWYLGWYFRIPVFDYQVRSTSTADDMKYDFDAVAYLRSAQQPPKSGKPPQRQDFLRKKALWQAYECPTPSVLLIDEIDKAPRDFPNDLLLELDKHRFRHPFVDQYIDYSASRPPIVVITSNAERRLPDAFLRRCIYHHIELTPELVRTVLHRWAKNPDFPDIQTIQEAALERFWELRDYEIQKKPSTAELLVWLIILSARGITATELRAASLGKLPALTVLIKDQADRDRLPNGPR
jgi:MoxR-like ATPase